MAYVSDRKGGGYAVRAYAGVNPVTGRPMTVGEVLPPEATEEELDAAIERVSRRAEVSKGGARLLSASALFGYYLESCEQGGASPATLKAYRSYLRRHIAPRIGRVPVEELTPAHFSRMYRELRRPASAGGAGLSASTVKKVHAFCCGCFTRMLRDGMVEGNPAAGIVLPMPEQREAAALSPEDVARLDRFVAAELADHGAGAYRRSLAIAWRLGLYAGLRRGEICGLQARHVTADPDGVSLRIARVLSYDGSEKAPKSRSSKRVVALDASTAAMVTAHAEGLAESAPLVRTDAGGPVMPDALTSEFGEAARRIGLAKGAHLHTLRHTHATYLLESGENILTVRERLGHQSAKTTMDIYGHVLPGRGREAAARFARAMEGIDGFG
ncbi:tyrosine-type recombinase/integrase [Berryella intestinalis]|uniref:tyrosine-type recombinase/integrase n=1 Tax=Berryella intestinalis TaxID=1531429 RepID=UPI00057F2813|nr:site-specific integrase [Berryella intestinalis]